MINAILGALWFFLPAGIANAMPLLAARLPLLKNYEYPLDFNKSFRGHRIFGSHKTWRGILFAFITAIPIVWLQIYLYNNSQYFHELSYFSYAGENLLWLSFLFSFGALIGDAVRSFFKRQADVKPGETWFPFDQIDFVIGGLLAISLAVDLQPEEYLLVALVYFLLHPVITGLGYMLNIREKPI